MKRILIEELKNNLDWKLKEEMRRLKAQEEKLINYKQVFSLLKEQRRNFISKKEEYLSIINRLNNEINKDKICKKNLIDTFSNENIDSSNCYQFVSIRNPDNFLKLLAMEATTEDMFFIIKRAYAKGILPYKFTIAFIRNLSREAFKLKYLRNKVEKSIDQKKSFFN